MDNVSPPVLGCERRGVAPRGDRVRKYPPGTRKGSLFGRSTPTNMHVDEAPYPRAI